MLCLLGTLFTQLSVVICCPKNHLSLFLSLFVQLATVTCFPQVMARDQLSNWLMLCLLGSLFTQLVMFICCLTNQLSLFLSLFVQLAIVTRFQQVMAHD